MESGLRFTPSMAAKRPKALPKLALLLAENLGRLCDKVEDERTGAEVRLAKAAKISASAAHRALEGTNATIATLERLASGYGLEAWELLHPALMPPPEPRPAAQWASLQQEVLVLREAIEAIKTTVHASPGSAPSGGSPASGTRGAPDAPQAGSHPPHRVRPRRE